MAVTYPIDFPSSIYLSGFSIRGVNAVSSSQSPFDFSQQVYDFGGEMWEVNASLPAMNRETAGDYIAFILKLKGKKGTFLLPVPEATPRGVATGTPLVDGGSQTGDSLDIKGATASVTGWLKAGDWIQLGTGADTRLHRVLDDVDTDGTGDATINIYPSLRTSPSDNAAVTVSNCKGLFKLTEEPIIDMDINKFYLLDFNCMESL